MEEISLVTPTPGPAVSHWTTEPQVVRLIPAQFIRLYWELLSTMYFLSQGLLAQFNNNSMG